MRITINYPGFCLDAELSFPQRGCIAFYGPSGSGKSTILRAAAGLIKGANTPLNREQIGFVPQNYMLFEHLSLAENLLSSRRKSLLDELQGLFRRRFCRTNLLDNHLLSLLQAAGISHLANARVTELSGGQRQRAALCCALANRPKYLLLDEPFSALDDESKRALISLLRRFMSDFELSVALISHSAAEVMALADCVHIIKDGRIAQSMDIQRFGATYNQPL